LVSGIGLCNSAGDYEAVPGFYPLEYVFSLKGTGFQPGSCKIKRSRGFENPLPRTKQAAEKTEFFEGDGLQAVRK
jgi:hypothetical protein